MGADARAQDIGAAEIQLRERVHGQRVYEIGGWECGAADRGAEGRQQWDESDHGGACAGRERPRT